MRPLVSSPDLRPTQAQALTKLIKQEPGLRAGLLRALLDTQLGPAAAAAGGVAPGGGGGAWREPHLVVLQSLLDARADCVVGQLPRLVAALAAACTGGDGGGGVGGAAGGGLARSPKLAQAMMALAAGFGPGLGREEVARLVAVAERTGSFLTKGLLTKLRQLQDAVL